MHINVSILSHYKTSNNFLHMIYKLRLPLCKINNVQYQFNSKANHLLHKCLLSKKQHITFYPPKQTNNLCIICKFLLQFHINSNLQLLSLDKHSPHYSIHLLTVNKNYKLLNGHYSKHDILSVYR